MNLQIDYTNEFPESLKASAEKCLRDGITFLEGIPRPTTLPEIEYLTPNFSEMEFKFGVDTWPHGLFSRTSMKGWCVLSYKASGDLLINSEPVVTVVGVDPNICTTASIVFTLDQYFIAGTYPEIHLHRQLSYLDSVAASNKSVRSLLDDFEQAQADKIEQERLDRLGSQQQDKWAQHCQQQRINTAFRIPLWFLQRYPDSPQSLKGEFIVTQSGHPIGTHTEWRNGSLAPPPIPPNKAVENLHKPKESKPFHDSDAEEQEVAGWLALYDAAMGRTPAGSCQDHDK